MTHDLLVDPFRAIFAINCKINGPTLHCGAIYVDPRNPFSIIRLSDSTANIDVSLPDELVNQPVPKTGWNVELPITETHEQVREHPVRS